MNSDDIRVMLGGLAGGTHMPCVVPGGPFLFCLAATSGAWRAHSWNGSGPPVPLGPEPPAGGVQCTPVGLMEAGRLRWSVVGTYPGSFAIHTDDGATSPTTGAGFSVPGAKARTRKIITRLHDGYHQATYAEINGAAFRLLADRQALAITPSGSGVCITTFRQDEQARCLFLDADGSLQEWKLPDGSSPYKPCAAFGGLFHAIQTGPGWEDRRIEWSDSFSAFATNAADWLEPIAAMPTHKTFAAKE